VPASDGDNRKNIFLSLFFFTPKYTGMGAEKQEQRQKFLP
jgi:hypothetical protein